MILAFYLQFLVIICSVMSSVTQYLGPQQQEEKQIAVLEQILLGRLKAIIERKTQQDMGIVNEFNMRFSNQMFTTQNLSQSLSSAVNDWKQQISDLKLLVEGQMSSIEDLRSISHNCKQQISDLKLLVEGHTSSIEDLSSNDLNQQISDLKRLVQEQKTAMETLRTQINAFDDLNQQISDLKRLVEGHTSSIEDLSSNNWNQQISDLQLLVQEQKTALRTQIIASNDLKQQISDLKLLVQEQRTDMDNLRTQIISPDRVRLIGPSLLEGRVAIYHNGEWGTVCDDYWEDVDASVVCKELGFRGGTAMGNAHYGQGTGTIWMDNVECTGNEPRLAECGFRGWNTEDCGHGEDAGVGCT